MHAVLYLQIFITTFAASVLTLTKGYDLAFSHVLWTTTAGAVYFLAGLYGSLLVYRIFLNPLNRFPGPWAVRLSTFFMSFQLGDSDLYLKLEALHQQHGRIVRIGSGDLSIIDPDGMDVSYGLNAKAIKSSWYDGDAPLTSMHTTRNKALHDKRRKVWAGAFADRALREYETVVDSYNAKIVQRFGESVGESVNVAKWFNLYSFDVMGRLAFGKDYGMLDSGEKHWALELLSEGMQPLGFMIPTWFFRLLVSIPGLAGGYHRFVKFCVDETTWRVENATKLDKSGNGDIMSWLLKAYQSVAKPQEDPMLQADTRLLIVAGDPAQVKKLREELRPLTRGDWSDKDIRHASHLNGAINESMRLHPPVPSGVSRLTPPEGMSVGGVYIPGGTTFVMPQYVMGRDESIYQRASEFVPERWYSKPEMVKHKDAFAPFSVGPFGCIGKNLALTEMRTLTARLVLAYDVQLAPGQAAAVKTTDHFTVDTGDVHLVFTRAEGS
ncbi:hypothetical protein LTR53_012755 [Teratosphaeriaceae sp. CCFEE 6253]|nr:hypothetical protein LTR53_012755 [Teratosphaeriaceae sp. CCFEE 6253]